MLTMPDICSCMLCRSRQIQAAGMVCYMRQVQWGARAQSMATCWSQGGQSRRHARSHSRRHGRRCRRRELRFRQLEDERQLLRRGCTEVGDDGASCGVRERFRYQAHAAFWGPSREGRVCHLRPDKCPSAGAIHILFHNRMCSWSLPSYMVGATQAESAGARNLHT